MLYVAVTRPVSVSSLLISVTPFLLTRPGPHPGPGPGHAAVLCSELCKLGPGLKYRMLLQSPAAGVYVKNPGDHGRNGPKYSLSLLGPQLLPGPGWTRQQLLGGPCTFQFVLVFRGQGTQF